MQKVRLPLTLDPYKTAQKRLDYVGYYPNSLAMRLSGAVVEINSDIEADFSFSVDMQGLTVISGKCQTQITLICQRCNQPFERSVHVKFCFSPVKDDRQEECLPGQYDPIDVDDFNEVNLLAAVEDEILLSLPIVPLHESEHCEVSTEKMVFGEIPDEEPEPNPFSILAKLKQK